MRKTANGPFDLTKRGLLVSGMGLAGLAMAPEALAQTALRGTVDQGNIQPLPIAIDINSGADASGNNIGAQISKVISADLERSGFFKPIDPNAFIAHEADVNVQPNFDNWRTINAQYLSNGRAFTDADGRLTVTDAFLRTYLARPELAPVAESCANELRLHDRLIAQPRSCALS